jgi:hypothetical protein
MCSIHHHIVCRIEHSLCVGGAGSRYFGCRCRPIECARRMVVPNSVHASRKRPLLVRKGPIMISACIPSREGLCMKEAMRSACIAAATGFPVRVLKVNICLITDCRHFPFVVLPSLCRPSIDLRTCPKPNIGSPRPKLQKEVRACRDTSVHSSWGPKESVRLRPV